MKTAVPAPDDAQAPAVVLVEPQMAANIGAAARAMMNCGLSDLRLVRPRDGWPNDEARPMASGADAILETARAFDSLADATADLHRLYATTARHRDMAKHEITPRRLADEVRSAAAGGQRAGVLFGRERIGLTNEEVAVCDALVVVPLNPAFSSLNLAQAVLLIAYEWRMAGDATPARRLVEPEGVPATRAELEGFFDRLEGSLETANFFRVEHMRAVMWRKIRAMFLRAQLAEREVKIWHGMLSALEGKKLGPSDRDAPG
ncbi:MAG: RNA methyltransferase [Acidobacteriota bacterium]